jgi:hypothetical protein
MALRSRIEHRIQYCVVRVAGSPTLKEFVSFLKSVAEQSREWPHGRVIFDLQNVESLTKFSEHYSIGRQVAPSFSHLVKVASVVTSERITRGTEKPVRQLGVNLKIFTSEHEAVLWMGAREASTGSPSTVERPIVSLDPSSRTSSVSR